MIQHIYDRLYGGFGNEANVIVAIPENDVKLKEHLEEKNIPYFSGYEFNVLKRYYDCACFLGLKDSDKIMRITGDCPFTDLEQAYYLFQIAKKKDKLDFISNCFPPRRCIDGEDVEIMSFNILKWLYYGGGYELSESDREHVTSYVYNNYDSLSIWHGFKIAKYISKDDNSHIKTSIDTMEDYERVKSAI